MMGVGGDTGRGVRVAVRGWRTWWRFGWTVAYWALGSGALGAAVKSFVGITAWEWHVLGVHMLSEVMLAFQFSPDKKKSIRGEDGTVYHETLRDIASFEGLIALRERVLDDIVGAAMLGGGIGVGLVLVAVFGLRTVGSRIRRGRRLRGGELTTATELARRTMPWWREMLLLMRGPEAVPYTVARIPWPRRAETLHTLVSGTTGSGKTVLISDLVEQIRARGERCVVYDKIGSYTETFFDRDRDVLLNPLDRRAPRWSPFLEARTARDFDTMAEALIPRQKDVADPFWITAARQLFSNGAAVLWKRGETHNRVLVEHLLKTELSELAEAMEETVVQSIVDPDNPKTALSVRAMLTASIATLDLLPDDGPPFSIREWVGHEGGGGFLFLTSRADQHASLRGLISTWLEIAVNAVLSLPGGGRRRVWVILDELPTLHQLPSLRPGLAQSRQYGGCFVLGVQVFSALREIYGGDGASTISGLCGTRVVLAAPDKDTSEWAAKSLGNVEVESLSEGVSYDTPHGGVTLSTRREERPLILPSEVARLENLSGYLKFPGKLPVARIGLRYRERKIVAPRFVPKEDEEERRSGGDGVSAAVAAAEAAPVEETGSSEGDGRPERDEPDRWRLTDAGEEAGEEAEWLFEGWMPADDGPDRPAGCPSEEAGGERTPDRAADVAEGAADAGLQADEGAGDAPGNRTMPSGLCRT